MHIIRPDQLKSVTDDFQLPRTKEAVLDTHGRRDNGQQEADTKSRPLESRKTISQLRCSVHVYEF